MRLPSIAVLALAALAASAWRSAASEDDVHRFSDRFLYGALALSPVSATATGYHRHNGINLDDLWDDYSEPAMRKAAGFFHDALADADRLAAANPDPESRADLDVIRLAARSQLLGIERIQPRHHNPTLYVEAIGNGLYYPFILNYAPENERLAHIAARLEKLPAFLDTARRGLASAPAIWIQVAIDEDHGNEELIDRTIRAKVPPALKARYDRAATAALAALHSFDDFLSKDLSRSADWRLGPALYPDKFAIELATGDTPQQALADAEARLASIREEMYRQSLALYGKFFPGRMPSGDRNAVISAVLDKIAQEHTTPADYFDAAKRDLAATTAFVKEHQILALPSGYDLQVIPTPEFMRGVYGVGGFSSAPVLEPKLGSSYWITPFTPDMSPARVESKLREYNAYGLVILTIHEAMPGHYVQFEYADQQRPEWRRNLRGIFSNTPYVEGWAVFATELMIDQGFRDTPEMRLTFGKQMLRVVANTILDIRLQSMNMTDRQALDLMIRDTFQEKEEAEKKLQRAKLSSCQLPTYFVGWRAWDRLRDAYRAEQGSAFRLAAFNERALKEGAVPMPVLRRLLLSQPTDSSRYPPGR